MLLKYLVRRRLCRSTTVKWGLGVVVVALLASCGQAKPRPVRPQADKNHGVQSDGASSNNIDLRTPYERSGKMATPRYDETIAYVRDLASASPKVTFQSFGTSPRRRLLPLVIVDEDGLTEPEKIRAAGRAIVLIEGCLHAGEAAGKDAGLMLVRDLSRDQKYEELLEHVSVLFIPIFNVDGHERFGPYNRINQNGPVEMGWRATSRNLNLNRDFLKADTVEMRAWLALYGKWLPEFFVDIHSTDGADYQYDITYSVESHGNMDPGLTRYVNTLMDDVVIEMEHADYKLHPYVSFKTWHDPKSGLLTGATSPRYSHGYTAVQNRPGLLIEAHMLKPYAVRVDSTYRMLLETLRHVAENRKTLQGAIEKADEFAASRQFRRQGLSLKFKGTSKAKTVEFLGVEYDVVKSDISGGDWYRYSSTPTSFKIPYYDEVVPAVTAELPEAYVIPPEWQDIIEVLELHGVKVARLEKPVELKVRSYRFEDIEWKAERPWNSLPYEGRHLCDFDAIPIEETRLLPKGSAIVDTAQRTARLIGHALEPMGPDSFVHWGSFNSIFQRVEYAESYVVEKIAREMLTKDPHLKKRFEQKKSASPEFAADPEAIRAWFYEQTPYFDASMNVYPVSLIDDEAALRKLQTVTDNAEEHFL